MSGIADDHIFTKQTPRGLNWKIILTDVYTICTNGKGDINAVIYYDLNAMMTGDQHCLLGFTIELVRREILVA